MLHLVYMEPQNSNKHKNIVLFGLVIGAFILGYFSHSQVRMMSFNNYGYHRAFDSRGYGRGMMGVGSYGGGYTNLSMSQMMQYMVFGIQGRTGDDFDAAFLQQMIAHHQGAIDMARLVLSTSTRPELVKFANDMITNQQKEIDTMVSWQKTWFAK